MKMKKVALCLSFVCLNAYHNNILSTIADPIEVLFTSIYKTNFWQSHETVSGPGSELNVTHRMRQELEGLIKRFSITTIADAPCGDCNWMRHVNLEACNYIGYDIVQDLIENNARLFEHTSKKFRHLNLIEGIIEKVDLIICRDMLAHLTDEQIFKVLQNFKDSGSKYILLTTNLAVHSNTQIDRAGDWRKLNLELPPFNFPRPLALIAEDTPFEWERGKCLALWFLDDVQV
jgi:hypothetical protein